MSPKRFQLHYGKFQIILRIRDRHIQVFVVLATKHLTVQSEL